MDFNDTPQEAAFRAEVQNWLTANVPTEAELADMDYIGRAKLCNNVSLHNTLQSSLRVGIHEAWC